MVKEYIDFIDLKKIVIVESYFSMAFLRVFSMNSEISVPFLRLFVNFSTNEISHAI